MVNATDSNETNETNETNDSQPEVASGGELAEGCQPSFLWHGLTVWTMMF